MKKLIAVLVVVQLVVLQAVLGQGIKVPVRVEKVVASDISSSIHSIGSVKARDQIVFSSKIMARINSITRDEGEKCLVGELLVEIDSAELDAKVSLLQAQKKEISANVNALKAELSGVQIRLESTGKDLGRQRALLKKGSTTQKNFDDAKTEYDSLAAKKDMLNARIRSVSQKSEQADANIREVRALLDYTDLKAPFDGYITEKYSFQGELAKPGAPIIKLLSLDTVKIELVVNEVDIEKVSIGQKIKFTADSFPGKIFESKVAKIVPEGNSINRSFRVHGMFRNEGENILKPGMFVRGEIITALHTEAALIPKDALLQNGDVFYVFRLDGEKAVEVEVKTGFKDETSVEILKGVKAGDMIITEGKQNLSDQSAVRIIR